MIPLRPASVSRRTFLGAAASGAVGLLLPAPSRDPERERLCTWLQTLREEGFTDPSAPPGPAVARAGSLALGTPYLAHTLEGYLAQGGAPASEPLTLRLTVFDCVTLVEAAVAAARTAAAGPDAGWERFAAETERMRYRGGRREGYGSRLHYFAEWISDGARRGLVRDLGPELGAVADLRPLRFMTSHRASYAALADPATFREVAARERALDGVPRHRVPKQRVAAAADSLHTGDVLAFTTGIEGLDVTHTGLAYRDRAGAVRLLHAPLSGGVVQITPGALAEYVDSLRGCTGVLAARPLPA